jgi:hypothetical protein
VSIDVSEAEFEGFLHRYPLLRTSHFRITSEADKTHNCVAYAAGDTSQKWLADPHLEPYGYWPPEAPREDTLQGWIAAFRTLGYRRCRNSELAPGYEKVVIYGTSGRPIHMALQQLSGKWKSKLGESYDIEHELEGVTESKYGHVLVVMRRRSDSR